MSNVAVLGTGLLGSGFVERMLGQGHAVRVWNRSADKLAPLVALGAVAADSPADAVRGADRVHLVLAADDAVEAVITALRPGLGDGVVIVDHSTNLPARVAARAEALAGEGIAYLHAPVFMAPANARAGTGLMLLSGSAALREVVTPALATLTGKVIDLGDRPDHAAVLKLIGNGLLIGTAGLMGDLFAVAQGAGLGSTDVLGLLEAFAPPPAFTAQRVLRSGTGPVGFELTMARKDIRLMIETAGAGRLDVLPAVAASMDAHIDAGQGAADYTIFAKR